MQRPREGGSWAELERLCAEIRLVCWGNKAAQSQVSVGDGRGLVGVQVRSARLVGLHPMRLPQQEMLKGFQIKE